MKFKTFGSKIINVNLAIYLSPAQRPLHKSSLHESSYELLKSLYPTHKLCEEVYIPELDGIFLDFYLPTISLVVEVQGAQHYKFNKFFFKSTIDFNKAIRRDEIKKEWCELNNLILVELLYNESICEWRNKLQNYR